MGALTNTVCVDVGVFGRSGEGFGWAEILINALTYKREISDFYVIC